MVECFHESIGFSSMYIAYVLFSLLKHNTVVASPATLLFFFLWKFTFYLFGVCSYESRAVELMYVIVTTCGNIVPPIPVNLFRDEGQVLHIPCTEHWHCLPGTANGKVLYLQNNTSLGPHITKVTRRQCTAQLTLQQVFRTRSICNHATNTVKLQITVFTKRKPYVGSLCVIQ